MNIQLSGLSAKTKGILISIATFALSMQADTVKNWVVSNLGQHPKLTTWGLALSSALAILHQPAVEAAVRGALSIKQTAPDKAEIEVK